MAQQRISDLWGGTPRLSLPLVRLLLAVLLALPLSAIGFAIADNPNTPAAARLIIAPGYVAAFHLPIYDEFDGILMSALALNVCYYTALLLGASRLWRRANTTRQHSE